MKSTQDQEQEEPNSLKLFSTALLPVDKTAVKVILPGVHYEVPSTTISCLHSDVPIPMCHYRNTNPLNKDLTGMKKGRLTVVGFYAGKTKKGYGGRWVVRCQCGDYELRSRKALLNPKNTGDRCCICRHEITRKRKYEFHKIGKNMKTYQEMMESE